MISAVKEQMAYEDKIKGVHMEDFMCVEIQQRPPWEGDMQDKTQRMRETQLCEGGH